MNRKSSDLKEHILLKVLCSVLCFAILLSVFSLIVSKYGLCVTHYTVSCSEDGGKIKVVNLSDLHSSVFGKENGRLIEKVRAEEPDIICLTGDTVSSDESDFSVAAFLVNGLSEICQVYISLGNHETDLGDELLEIFISDMEAAGGTILEKEYIDTEINGNKVRIGGTSGYGLSVKFWEASYLKNAEDYLDDDSFSEQRFLLEFEKTDSYKILLQLLNYKKEKDN